jgi:hypothetical protein
VAISRQHAMQYKSARLMADSAASKRRGALARDLKRLFDPGNVAIERVSHPVSRILGSPISRAIAHACCKARSSRMMVLRISSLTIVVGLLSRHLSTVTELGLHPLRVTLRREDDVLAWKKTMSAMVVACTWERRTLIDLPPIWHGGLPPASIDQIQPGWIALQVARRDWLGSHRYPPFPQPPRARLDEIFSPREAAAVLGRRDAEMA